MQPMDEIRVTLYSMQENRKKISIEKEEAGGLAYCLDMVDGRIRILRDSAVTFQAV
jgi:hypothetical protein